MVSHKIPEGLLDLVPNEWSEFNWDGMPSFQHGDLSPKRSILVHFASDVDVEAFCRAIGQEVSAKTKYLWYPKLEEGVFADKVYASARPLNPQYPVYVISKGRWETRLTVKALEKIRVPYHVVVEPQERDKYARYVDPEKILVLPFSNLGQGSIPARNWVWDHSISIGAKRHWILDDNIRSFYYYHENLKYRVGDGTCFAAIEQWVDQHENVPIAGMQYYMFMPRKRGWEHRPVTLNTRVYSCILIENSLEHRWRGRYNEDTDLSIRVLKDGKCTALFCVFLAEKMATMTMKGGNTDQLYVDDGRLKMAESLREQHPDVVHIIERWGRAQHFVNYEPFKFNKLIRNPDAKPLDLGDVMSLQVVNPSLVNQEPVRINFKAKAELEKDQPSPALLDDPSPALLVDPSPALPDDSFSLLPVEVKPAKNKVLKPKPETSALEMPQQAPAVIGVKPRMFAEVNAKPREVWKDPFLRDNEETLLRAGNGRIILDEATWDHEAKTPVVFDTEVFQNFFVACFKRLSDAKRIAFEMSDRCQLDREGLHKVLTSNPIVSFNGDHYDLPIVAAAIDGASCARLKGISQQIIDGQVKPWEAAAKLGVRFPKVNHVDLMEPNPSVRQGLKMIYARLHGKYLVDLPYEPDAWLTPHQMNVLTLYCLNDLEATEALHQACREPLELRVALSREYKVDFRSKSDAQIGEAIVKLRVEKATGRRVGRATQASGATRVRYSPPPFIQFEGHCLREVLRELKVTDFVINSYGKPETPELLKDLQIALGDATYTMGIGGLHSTEAHRALHSTSERALIDLDVASQYPNIIMKLGMYPKLLGPKFLEVYGALIAERMRAKDADEKAKADGLKIATNGVFGKLGSVYSPLYSPEIFIATTLTGQLSVLMLIEKAEREGIPIVSANTDGVVAHCPRDKESQLQEIVSEWEQRTGFRVERHRYESLYTSSVNTYLAIDETGKPKRKGPIADPWKEGDLRGQMSKNPQMTICSEAVLQLAVAGTPVADTIRASTDPRQFVTVVKADGAAWRGHPIGRVARYYWSTDGDPIYVDSGKRKVSKTDGAKPLLVMTEQLPPDLDYDRYIEEATKLSIDLCVAADPQVLAK